MPVNARLLRPRSTGFSPLSLSPALWMKETGLYQERTGASATTPSAANGDPVGTRLDYSGHAKHYTAPSDTTRPVIATVNSLIAVQPDAVDDYLTGGMVTLTGAFTIYAIGTRAMSTNWIPLATDGAGSLLTVFGDDVIYIQGDGLVSAPYTGSAGTILARFRRTAADSCRFAATGMAEVTLGTEAGDLTFNTHGARPGASQMNGGTNKHCELVVVASDILTDSPAQDAAMLAYSLEKWGVAI